MINYKFILFSILFLFASCVKNDRYALKSKNGFTYQRSLSQWNELKSKHGNSYSYQITFSSWTGYGHTTSLKIINGIIVSRTYQSYQIDDSNGQKIPKDSYLEDESNLGAHEMGALPRTIDELYQTCAKEYLIVDQKNNKILFETDEKGLMSLCGFIPNNCQDDCFEGVNINAFNWL